MSRTHDVTISAFDLDHLEKELAAVTAQRDRLAEALNGIVACSFNCENALDEAEKMEWIAEQALQSLKQTMTDPANFYARLASSIDADTRRERAALCPSDSTTCSRCAELEKNFRAALRVIANLEETIDRLETPPAPKYVPRCTHCHHRHATETNGLCGVCACRNGLANAKAIASADARPTTKKTTL